MADEGQPSNAAATQAQEPPPEPVDLTIHPSGIVPKLQVRISLLFLPQAPFHNYYPSFAPPLFCSHRLPMLLFLSTERRGYGQLRMYFGLKTHCITCS